MIDIPTLVLSWLLLLELSGEAPTPPDPGPEVPPGVEITTRGDIRIPWGAKTYDVGRGPFFVEMSDIIAQTEKEVDLEPEPGELREKNRIPGMLPPELIALQRLEAELLPPSDKVQVLTPGAPNKSVTGSLSQDAIDASSSNSVPPDPELAVGPSHVIAVVNSRYRIFSASTGSPLISATRLSTLMSANSDCTGLFDPNVLYDEEYDRFLIGADANGSDYCLAVSTTSNPLGTWAVYSIAADIGGLLLRLSPCWRWPRGHLCGFESILRRRQR